MSGNGYEWTRDVISLVGKQVPLLTGDKSKERVALRGSGFEEKPLEFRDLDIVPSASYVNPEYDVGLRVVIETR
jgi:hypothetical protein